MSAYKLSVFCCVISITRNTIANGVAGTFTVGQTISSSPGNDGNSSPVKTGFQDRVNAHDQMYPNIDPNTMCTSNGGNPAIPTNDPLFVTVPASISPDATAAAA